MPARNSNFIVNSKLFIYKGHTHLQISQISAIRFYTTGGELVAPEREEVLQERFRISDRKGLIGLAALLMLLGIILYINSIFTPLNLLAACGAAVTIAWLVNKHRTSESITRTVPEKRKEVFYNLEIVMTGRNKPYIFKSTVEDRIRAARDAIVEVMNKDSIGAVTIEAEGVTVGNVETAVINETSSDAQED